MFFLLLGKLIPLYVLILFGYVAGKLMHARRETVATLLIYFIVPVVIFHGVSTTRLDPSLLALPIVFYILCSAICVLFFWIGSFFWKDSTRNILAYTCGNGNNGYFGLPLLIALFSEQAFGVGIIAGLGFLLYETTLGLFLVAKSNRTALQSVKKVMTIPLPYAFALGLTFNLIGWHLPQPAVDLFISFRGAYTVLGMMLIGLGISGTVSTRLVPDVPFVVVAFIAKFLVWPLLMLCILALDTHVLHFFSPLAHQVMIVFSVIPLAANTVAYATELKTHPEKAASAVLLSTLFALFYVPAVLSFLLG